MFLDVFLLTVFEHQGCFHMLCYVCLYCLKHGKFLWSEEVKCRKSRADMFMQLQISRYFRELIFRSQGSMLLQ